MVGQIDKDTGDDEQIQRRRYHKSACTLQKKSGRDFPIPNFNCLPGLENPHASHALLPLVPLGLAPLAGSRTPP